jgi:hypothetical protein
VPAEIWRNNEKTVTKVFLKDKEVTDIKLDPKEETSDIKTEDNVFPRSASGNKFDAIKKKN